MGLTRGCGKCLMWVELTKGVISHCLGCFPDVGGAYKRCDHIALGVSLMWVELTKGVITLPWVFP